MKRRYKIFTLCISLLLGSILLPNGLLWSCGPTLIPDESRFALFRTGMDGRTGFKPFYYSECLFNLSEADPDSIDRRMNCKEWVAFTHHQAKESDVYRIQYKTTPTSFINACKSQNLNSFRNNTFIAWLEKEENRQALDYMMMAKAAEDKQALSLDPWDTSSVNKYTMLTTIATLACERLQHKMPLFLKQRYAFQAIKSTYYAKEGSDSKNALIIKQFEQYLNNKKSIVAAWAELYYAMVQPDINKRTLFLLKAFDDCEEKKKFCFQQITIRDLTSLQKVTTDKHTLMLIQIFKALANKGKALSEISLVSKYDPEGKYLCLLITREINKLENWLWSSEVLKFPDNYRLETDSTNSKTDNKKMKIQDLKYLDDVITYLKKQSGSRTRKQSYEELALLHLYLLQHNVVKAKHQFLKLQHFQNREFETQRLIEEVMLIAQTQNVLLPKLQGHLASIVSKLKRLNPSFASQKYRTDEEWDWDKDDKNSDALSELYLILSHSFKQRGEIVIAGLLYNKANVLINNYDGFSENDTGLNYHQIAFFDRYSSPDDIKKLLQFKYQKGKTPFQQMLVPEHWVIDDFYKDLEGTILFRQKKYDEALAVFGKIDAQFWEKNYKYKDYLPKNSVTYMGMLIPSEKSKPLTYNLISKKLIVAEIVALQHALKTAKNNDIKADIYYKLANAFSNVSYSGTAWMMMSYGKTSRELYFDQDNNYHWAFYNFSVNDKKYGQDYYNCRTAMATYKQALRLATDKELMAKCLLAMAVCDKRSYDYDMRRGTSYDRTHKYYSWYLKELKKKYASTIAFREAVAHCPDVKE